MSLAIAIFGETRVVPCDLVQHCHPIEADRQAHPLRRLPWLLPPPILVALSRQRLDTEQMPLMASDPSRTSGTPTIPSLPTRATSAKEPPWTGLASETTHLVRKGG